MSINGEGSFFSIRTLVEAVYIGVFDKVTIRKTAKTIAKTMSAYDVTFSDAIYGKEKSGRYVCESRLIKMLEKEYSLLEERLGEMRGKETRFFVFANTVAAKF